jgi:uncharacterized protein with GYD domain
MALYLSRAQYTPEAIAAQIHNPVDRGELLRAYLEKATGGRVVAYGYPVGQPGVVVLMDLPDEIVGAGAALANYSRGAMTGFSAERLMSGAEWVAALTAAQGPAGEYIPPGQT